MATVDSVSDDPTTMLAAHTMQMEGQTPSLTKGLRLDLEDVLRGQAEVPLTEPLPHLGTAFADDEDAFLLEDDE